MKKLIKIVFVFERTGEEEEVGGKRDEERGGLGWHRGVPREPADLYGRVLVVDGAVSASPHTDYA